MLLKILFLISFWTLSRSLWVEFNGKRRRFLYECNIKREYSDGQFVMTRRGTAVIPTWEYYLKFPQKIFCNKKKTKWQKRKENETGRVANGEHERGENVGDNFRRWMCQCVGDFRKTIKKNIYFLQSKWFSSLMRSGMLNDGRAAQWVSDQWSKKLLKIINWNRNGLKFRNLRTFIFH